MRPTPQPAPAESSRHSTLGLAGPIVDDTHNRFYRRSHQAFPTPIQTIACLFAARIVRPRQVPRPLTTIVLTSFFYGGSWVLNEKSPSGRVYVGISTKNMAPPPARKKLCHFSECVAKTRQKRRPELPVLADFSERLAQSKIEKKQCSKVALVSRFTFAATVVSILVR